MLCAVCCELWTGRQAARCVRTLSRPGMCCELQHCMWQCRGQQLWLLCHWIIAHRSTATPVASRMQTLRCINRHAFDCITATDNLHGDVHPITLRTEVTTPEAELHGY